MYFFDRKCLNENKAGETEKELQDLKRKLANERESFEKKLNEQRENYEQKLENQKQVFQEKFSQQREINENLSTKFEKMKNLAKRGSQAMIDHADSFLDVISEDLEKHRYVFLKEKEFAEERMGKIKALFGDKGQDNVT